ncbi:MAG TPA: glycerol-3-phosphate 1-O-acyltransferase PlsY, partial [Gemmataceae bacterium]|nr:glycerol-3-phosphate 1-O-acyltransferase PlsY [Gemmataceae bacterium]
MLIALLALAVSYLAGAIPFGWLVARARGIDIFQVGSGNIGATNVGRTLGRKYGLLVFALDFAKGAVPVLVAGHLPDDGQTALSVPDALRVGCAVAAYLGHMFPVFLGFRGGKGVATGLGTVLVLVPGPALLAAAAALAVVCATRMISAGSLAAVAVLCAARLLSVPAPFGTDGIAVTLFLLVGSAVLVVKHRGNIQRIQNGNENRLEDRPMFGTLARGIHVTSLGLWFGGAVMFNFIVAPTVFFDAFPAVVRDAPSDRTAYQPLAPGASDEQKTQLATALAGSAVGPIFPKFFALQAACGTFALITALGWMRAPGRVHRWRVWVVGLAAATVAVGWPISTKVSALRLERFAPDAGAAEAARTAFASWHLVSLLLSLVTAVLVGVALLLAAEMPGEGKAPA